MRDKLSEYQAVEKAAMKFVKRVAEGNSKYAKELFIDEAVLFGYLDGELEHGSIQRFLNRNYVHSRFEVVARAYRVYVVIELLN